MATSGGRIVAGLSSLKRVPWHGCPGAPGLVAMSAGTGESPKAPGHDPRVSRGTTCFERFTRRTANGKPAAKSLKQAKDVLRLDRATHPHRRLFRRGVRGNVLTRRISGE